MYTILTQIATRDGPSLVEIARNLHEPHNSILHVIDRLEDMVLGERIPDIHDRRIKHIHLTKQGRQLLRDIEPTLQQPNEVIQKPEREGGLELPAAGENKWPPIGLLGASLGGSEPP